MRWKLSPLKIIHWDFEPNFVKDFTLYKPDIKMNYDLHDSLNDPTGWQWKFRWRFRVYDKDMKDVYLSCIGENYADITFIEPKEHDEDTLDRMFKSSLMNFELKLAELVKENNLPSNIKIQQVFLLPKENVLDILGLLKKKLQP